MDLKQFRAHAHELVDWMADYLETVGERRVVPNVTPGEIQAALPAAPPQQAEPFEQIFADFQETIVPGVTHWQHPGWFAYFPANSSPPSVLAEMLTATLAVQGMSWQTSPAATELEQVVMNWLRQMIGLPTSFHGVIQDTASTATLVALLCARERATDFQYGEQGGANLGDERLRVYASDQAHASVLKGVKLAGYGTDNLRTVESDNAFRMRAEALRAALDEDLADGYRPAAVVATVGTTSSGAVDELESVAELCRERNIWLHVDAAWAGSAAICPEFRHLLAGAEQADSVLFNPHKWLNTNFDCTAFFVRDRETLLRTLTTSPEYLRTAVDAQVTNFRDWQIQLGRRFRALKLWFVIRAYGVSGLQDMIRGHIDMARTFAEWVEQTPDFELLAPRTLALVCFRYRPADVDAKRLDELNRQLLQKVNASGEVHLTHTVLAGRYTIRLAVGQTYTCQAHVAHAWELVKHAADTLTPNVP